MGEEQPNCSSEVKIYDAEKVIFFILKVYKYIEMARVESDLYESGVWNAGQS